MIPALVFLVLCSPVASLRVQRHVLEDSPPTKDSKQGVDFQKQVSLEDSQPVDSQPVGSQKQGSCGIVMGAFGSKSYVDIADKVLKHISALEFPKGWCPEQPELDKAQIAFFTDLKDHVCPAGVQCLDETAMASWDGGAKKMSGGSSHLGNWKYRFYHAQMLVNSPFDLTLYLDVDALPCSGDAIAKVFSVFKEGATLGSILKPESPRPKALEACDADPQKCAQKADRNAGVILADIRKTKPLFESWSEEVKKIAGHADGDQAAYIIAIRKHIKDNDIDLNEHFFGYKQISRHQRDNCKNNNETLIHHSKHMTSLQAAGII